MLERFIGVLDNGSRRRLLLAAAAGTALTWYALANMPVAGAQPPGDGTNPPANTNCVLDTDGDGVDDIWIVQNGPKGRESVGWDIGGGHAMQIDGKVSAGVSGDPQNPRRCFVWIDGKVVMILEDKNGDGDFGDEGEMQRPESKSPPKKSGGR